jgi:hypothetical protein
MCDGACHHLNPEEDCRFRCWGFKKASSQNQLKVNAEAWCLLDRPWLSRFPFPMPAVKKLPSEKHK